MTDHGFGHECDCEAIDCLCLAWVLCTHGTSQPCICDDCLAGVHDYDDDFYAEDPRDEPS